MLLSCRQRVPKATSDRPAGHSAALTRMPGNWSQPAWTCRETSTDFWGLGGLWDTLWEKKPVVHVFCSAIWTQTQTLSRPCLFFHIVRGGTQARGRFAGIWVPRTVRLSPWPVAEWLQPLAAVFANGNATQTPRGPQSAFRTQDAEMGLRVPGLAEEMDEPRG